MSLFAELQRRNVFRVAALYVVGGWLILQIGDLLFDLMGLPDFALRIVLGILLLGLPVALVLAWVYELTPEGLKRDSEATRSETTASNTGRKLNIAVIVVVLLGIATLVVDRFVLSQPEAGADEAASVADATTAEAVPVSGYPETGTDPIDPAGDTVSPRSIAVLPFANLSSDEENEYFADGLSEELLNVLAKVDGLKVAGRTSSFYFKGKNEDLTLIGEKLGVAHILEGSVRKQDDRIRVTAQLIQADDGFHLWSETYDRTLDDIFAIQDDIAGSVVEALVETLLGDHASGAPGTGQALLGGTTSAREISTVRDVDPRIYARYLEARARQNQRTLEDTRIAHDMFQAITVDAPAFDPGWSGLATSSLLLRGNHGALSTAQAHQTAEEAIRRALALNPNSATAWAARGYLTIDSLGAGEDDSVVAEGLEALERATRLDPGLTDAWYWQAILRESLFDGAGAVAAYQRALAIDPLARVPAMRLPRALVLIGREQEAREAVQFIIEAFGAHSFVDLNLSNWAETAGRADAAYGYGLRAFERNPDDGRTGFIAAHGAEHIGDRATALAMLRRIKAPQIMADRAGIMIDVLEGRVENALATARSLAAAESDPGAFAGVLLELLCATGRFDAALAEIERQAPTLIADDPSVTATNAGTASWTALVLRHTGRKDSADRLVQRALDAIEPAREGIPWALEPVYDRLALLAAGERFTELTREAEAALARNLRLNKTGETMWTFESDPRFAAAMGHPPFVAVVDRIKAAGAEALARYQAGETELLTPMSFLAELKRRNVIRVGILYVVGSWLILQVGDLLFDLMGLPDFALRIVLGILLLGLPAALVFAWIYELTPEGIRRERDIEPNAGVTGRTGQRLNLAVVIAIALAIATLLLDRMVLQPDAALDGSGVTVQVNAVAEAPGEKEPVTVPETTSAQGPTSVAVLPFRDMSAAGDQAYFGEGIAEELINALVGVDGLKVASRTSTFKLAGEDLAIPALAERLGVNHVLEGSVRTAGERIRITAQLIDVSDDTHLWSESYDRQLTDIFAVQDDIAAKILEELTEQLGTSLRPSAVALTASTKAYQRYLEGRHLWRKRGNENIKAAQAHFEAAVALDPAFHQAWSSLASTHFLQSVPDTNPFESENLRRAGELARHALELEADSAEALAILGVTEQFLCQPLRAAEFFERAIADGTPDPTPHHWYALLLMQLGHLDRAADRARIGLDLDPLIPALRSTLGNIEIARGNVEIALAYQREAQRQMEVQPDIQELVAEAILGSGDPSSRDPRVDVAAGDQAGLERIARTFLADPTQDRMLLNNLVNALALHDSPVALELIMTRRCPSGGWHFWGPTFSQRDTPRFSEFLRRLGAPEFWAVHGPPDECASLEPGLVECTAP